MRTLSLTLIALLQVSLNAAPKKIGHPSFLSPHARPILAHEGRVFVANTPSDSVDVIDAKTRKVIRRIPVGIDPVSLALRPDGRELWVANHVSDSVSVIDTHPESRTYLRVVDTVQDFDLRTKATRFDEPVGIAFANNEKAYVALSSENKIAIIDVRSRKVRRHLNITAQDPRAIVVRNGKLYVIPFESNNKTQLSGGYKIDDKLVTFNAHEHSIANNNVLSLGHKTDIVKHPRVPDRDLYVFNTKTDQLVKTVSTLGTLLYGLAVDSEGTVFIAQTDARNEVNGRSGTKKHGLKELENRAFLNQITRVSFKGNDAQKPEFINLEPLPPKQPKREDALATPFAVQVSDDDQTLYVTAAGSDKLFTLDAATGKILGRTSVGAVPRGIALDEDHAWVLNAVANTVSVVNITDRTAPKTEASITLHDPTHPDFKRGRIAFNTAKASTTATFSCASCHPDGHTDQLLWVLDTPIVTRGNQIMPRSTMPIRGLRDTAPFHWDGIPGDPYGGINSANIRSHVKPNSSVDKPESQTRHLIDGGLASTMSTVGDETKNDEGKSGRLTKAERDDMAKFLLNVTYPPAQRRAFDNVLSERAKEGFDLFHIKGDNDPKRPAPNVCGDCHRMPFWVSTNTPGNGMDAPTWRGAYDRFLILPQGRLNIIDFDFYRRVAETGNSERRIWQFSWGGRRRFDPVWDMVLEGSTGFSGTFARQVTLNSSTASEPLTTALLDALESTAREGGIVLQCEGVFLSEKTSHPITMHFGKMYEPSDGNQSYTRRRLLQLAREGKFIGTFTARHGTKADYDHPQPALWTLSEIHQQSGRQKFPKVTAKQKTMRLRGRHIEEGAHVLVNGRRVKASIKHNEEERLDITLAKVPSLGTHYLQIQNVDGLFSNDFIFHVTADTELQETLGTAVRIGDVLSVQETLAAGANPNQPVEAGNSALSTAAFHGQLDVMRLLLEKSGEVNAVNEDGNTALHVAAFMCRTEIVQLLLAKGASVTERNGRRERAIDTVSGTWSEGLAGFYRNLNASATNKVDLEQIQKLRPQIAEILREHAAK